jgi:HEAT repeat protein
LSVYGQTRADLQQMFTDLEKAETTDNAAAQLRLDVKDYPAIRHFLVQNLAGLIRAAGPGQVRLNLVRIAGDFKIEEAVPALVEQLGDAHTEGGPVTMAEALRLDNDPAGKALAQIGDAAVPAVESSLKSGERFIRFRAVYVLWNIRSERAKEVLRTHIDSESDPAVRRFIQTSLSTQ